MENFFDIEFIYLKNTELNVYKKAHIIFYSTHEDKIKFLMVKNLLQNSKYSQISTSVMTQDNTPTFSISRVLASDFQSLFNDENINKILKQEKLQKEDILDKTNYYHELWERKNFYYWLEKISEKPIIQYDCVKDHQFYFYELPFLPNIEKLNENLNELSYEYNFKYFDSDYFKENNQTDEINQITLKVFNSFDVEDHIKKSLENIQNNRLEKFYILSIKPAEGSKQDQAGFFYFPALFQGIYRKNTEIWIYLVCSLDKLPQESELGNAKAILIPGSHLSVYNDHDFLRKTEEWIKNFHTNHESVKFLGICFGMQIFMTALGGKVEKIPNMPFISGPTKIDLNEKFWDLEFIKKSGVEKSDSLCIMQAHGDECTLIPNELKITNYGKSDSCFNEILVCENERIFLIQGHPEYRPEFNIERMLPYILMRDKKEKTLENLLELKEKLTKDMLKVEVNSIEFRKMCNSFLKN